MHVFTSYMHWFLFISFVIFFNYIQWRHSRSLDWKNATNPILILACITVWRNIPGSARSRPYRGGDSREFRGGRPFVSEAPPNSGKTTSALQIAGTIDTSVTYLAGRTNLYQEALETIAEIEESNDVTAQTIPSPHRDCETFSGTDAKAKKVRRLYSKGVSGYKIHYSGRGGAYTPCMGGKRL